MRTTGLGLSAIFIAVGAILTWAVTAEAEGVDINQVGMILFIVGLGLAAVTLLVAATGRRTVVQTDRESVVDDRPVVQRQRKVITESEPPAQVQR